MRSRACVAFAAWLLGAAVPIAAQAPSSSERQEILERVIATHAVGEPVVHAGAPCMSVVEIAWAVRAPAGCEEPTDSFDRVGMETSGLGGLTVREALDRLVELNPSFAWRVEDGQVLVRPAGAWDEEEHFLRERLAAMRLEPPRVLTGGIEGIGRLWTGGALQISEEPLLEARVAALDFAGGTVLDLLNTLAARPDAPLIWRVVYPAGEARPSRIAIELITMGGEGSRWEWERR